MLLGGHVNICLPKCSVFKNHCNYFLSLSNRSKQWWMDRDPDFIGYAFPINLIWKHKASGYSPPPDGSTYWRALHFKNALHQSTVKTITSTQLAWHRLRTVDVRNCSARGLDILKVKIYLLQQQEVQKLWRTCTHTWHWLPGSVPDTLAG